MKKLFLLTIALFLSASISQATIVGYDIFWDGPNGYSLTGNFEFDDATVGEKVSADELTSFNIEGFLGASLLGSFSGIPNDFEFDVASEFLQDAVPQDWNRAGPGIGMSLNIFFGVGIVDMHLDGTTIPGAGIPFGEHGFSTTPSVSIVPLPSALPLYASGIAIFGLLAWRKKARNPSNPLSTA